MGTKPSQGADRDLVGNAGRSRWVPLPADASHRRSGSMLLFDQLTVIADLLRIQIHEARMMHDEAMQSRTFLEGYKG